MPAHRARTNPERPNFCPNDTSIDSWRFRLKHSRFGDWNGHRLGDLPNAAVIELCDAESVRSPTGFITDKLLGERIRRGLIGDQRLKPDRRRR